MAFKSDLDPELGYINRNRTEIPTVFFKHFIYHDLYYTYLHLDN